MNTNQLVALRPYQQNLIDQVNAHLYPPQQDYNLPPGMMTPVATEQPLTRVIVQMPTGAGKTVVAASLIAQARERGEKVLFFVHRQYLIAQSVKALNDLGLTCGVISAKEQVKDVSADCQVAMISSRKQIDRFIKYANFNPELVICDECHHCEALTWLHQLNRFNNPPPKVIGLSATPVRPAKTLRQEAEDGITLQKPFEKVICSPPVATLVSQGFLAGTDVIFAPEVVGRGEFDENGDWQTLGELSTNHVAKDAVGLWQKHAGQKQTLLFAASVEEAEKIATAFNDNGIKADCIKSETPIFNRRRILQDFESRKIKVLCNHNIFTEGYDCPGVECVVLANPTQSLVRHLQQVGRVMRPKPDGSNGLIMDLCGNTMRFGLPEKERDWTIQEDAPLPRQASEEYAEIMRGGGGVRKLSFTEVEEMVVAARKEKQGLSVARLQERADAFAKSSSFRLFTAYCWDAKVMVDKGVQIDLAAVINYANEKRGKSPFVAKHITPLLAQSSSATDFHKRYKAHINEYMSPRKSYHPRSFGFPRKASPKAQFSAPLPAAATPPAKVSGLSMPPGYQGVLPPGYVVAPLPVAVPYDPFSPEGIAEMRRGN